MNKKAKKRKSFIFGYRCLDCGAKLYDAKSRLLKCRSCKSKKIIIFSKEESTIENSNKAILKLVTMYIKLAKKSLIEKDFDRGENEEILLARLAHFDKIKKTLKENPDYKGEIESFSK